MPASRFRWLNSISLLSRLDLTTETASGNSLIQRLWPAFFLLFPAALPAAAQDSWRVDRWEPPFDYSGTPQAVIYTPVEKAKKPWRICASYPHLKDSYWLSVNYGMVVQAQKAGVKLRIVEAGGYPNLERQKAQITECAKNADAVIVGAVSFDGLTPLVKSLSAHMPVIAAVNDIANDGIAAKSGVSWVSMGAAIGNYFAALHPKGSPPVEVAWFPGPKGAGWVKFVEEGFRPAIARSSAEIVAVKWGDTGFEAQLLLLEETLEEHPGIDYIIGSAVTAGAAVSLLRAKIDVVIQFQVFERAGEDGRVQKVRRITEVYYDPAYKRKQLG